MLRRRFSSGVILGLLLGIPGGVLLGLLVLPTHLDQETATTLQVQDLTRRLEAAQEDKRRVDRQLEQFQHLAEQMTASFNSLEQRFKALEEEARLRSTRVGTSAVAPAPAAPTATAIPATASPTVAGESAAPAATAAPE